VTIEICFALGCNSTIRHNTKGYFGTGESFVFSLAPGSTCYEWIAAVQMKERKQRMDNVRFDCWIEWLYYGSHAECGQRATWPQ
jgi:hypothetical protein